jgi:hypothetical protein
MVRAELTDYRFWQVIEVAIAVDDKMGIGMTANSEQLQ